MNTVLFTTDKEIILASASPRRQAFLQELGLQFSTVPASIDETPAAGESAESFACRMAGDKAEAVAACNPAAVVIGADTVISCGGEILGKPENPDHALVILKKLQGAPHTVLSALSLRCTQESLFTTVVRKTTVTFGSFSDAVLKAYIRSGEPMDKAGAYAIQGRGGFLVREINGSCSNVIGMPMHTLVTVLLSHGVISPCRAE